MVFESFLAFFFPDISNDIDWGRGYDCSPSVEPIFRSSSANR